MERKIAIAPTDTAGVLHDRLKTLAAEMIVPALAGYAAGELLPRPQSDKGVCYAHKIDKAEARIDWTKPADYLQYHIHGLSPFPGAYSMLPTADAAPLRVKFLNVAPAAGQAGAPPGTVIGVPLTIACGAGSALRVLKAQRAGRAPMAAETLVRGLDLSPGTFFS